jgi:hypothetical protein
MVLDGWDKSMDGENNVYTRMFTQELCMRMDGINEHWCNLHLLTIVLAKRVVMFKNISIKLLSCV